MNADHSTPPPSTVPQCRCGHTKDHFMVSPEGDYTFWGWITVTLGMSTHPIKIRYRCRICKTVISETTDPKLLRRSL